MEQINKHLFLCFSIFLFTLPSMADDPLEELWLANDSSINSIDVELSVRNVHGVFRDVKAIVDLASDRLKGTFFQPSPKPNNEGFIYERRLGQQQDSQWHAERNEDGTMTFLIEQKNNNNYKQWFAGELKIPLLLKAIRPFHLDYLNDSDVEITLVDRKWSVLNKKSERIEYLAVSGDRKVTFIYYVDLSDGIRIYRSEVRIDGHVVDLMECENFHKYRGIWFPHDMVHKKTTKPGGDILKVKDEFHINRMDINRLFEEKDFKPHIQVGDYVRDFVIGVYYQVSDDPVKQTFSVGGTVETSGGNSHKVDNRSVDNTNQKDVLADDSNSVYTAEKRAEMPPDNSDRNSQIWWKWGPLMFILCIGLFILTKKLTSGSCN